MTYRCTHGPQACQVWQEWDYLRGVLVFYSCLHYQDKINSDEGKMKIKLVRGNETVELEADDEWLNASLAYSGIFERQVKEALKGFYSTQYKGEGDDNE